MGSTPPDDRRGAPRGSPGVQHVAGGDPDAAILAARARALARCAQPESPHAILVLTFSAGDERYALELERVLRVERVDAVTRVPRSAPGVVGLFNLHGRPCALLDAPALLGGGEATPRRWGVVLGARHAEVALAADEVEAARIERPTPRPGPFQLGVTPDARILLDADAFLAAPPAAGHGAGGAR